MKRWMRGFIMFAAVALVLGAAAPRGAREAGQRQGGGARETTVPDGVTLESDVVYASPNGSDQVLDIAYPAQRGEKPVPVVVHIHGGGWQSGEKNTRVALRYAQKGWVGVAINYRLSGEAPFPAAVHDCKAAIRWLRANAEKYGIDPKRVGITGSSAGGHLVALLGASGGDEYLEGDEGNLEYSSAAQAVVDHYGPTDLLKLDDNVLDGSMKHNTPESPESKFIGGWIAENVEKVRLANPITYIDPMDPPILIIHGENDHTVTIHQSEIFHDALNAAGVTTDFIRVKNADHNYRPNPAGSTIEPSNSEITAKEVAWFEKYLGQGEAEPVAANAMEDAAEK